MAEAKLNTGVKNDTETMESLKFGHVYIRIGRGDSTVPLVLSPQLVELLYKTMRDQTIRGDMATGGGTTGRTPKGNELADEIFQLTDLLIEKAD